jgi:uncharacterized protein YbjT (DUF2867 family)
MASSLVALNGSGNIARSVLSRVLQTSGASSLKLVDARPYRQSVYRWQASLANVELHKALARSVHSIDIGLEGESQAVYFTHDYFSMASEKNNHLIAMAKLTKKHGIHRAVAVCPFEHDLAWSEDHKSYFDRVAEAEEEALQANPFLTILKPNLAFGPETHLIHYLTQCAIIGTCPYKNLISKTNEFHYSPVHTNDIADAVSSALQTPRPGRFSVNGPETLTLRGIMDALEIQAGKDAGATKGPLFPPLDLVWDFFTGTTSDLNMSRMVEFYE